ncbi:Nucleoid-associated protein YbaB [Spiroplasma sp. JKS002669]|uniref:YbaB/EbfC family nucleoid-associated protein n=1 Tax=Spiroplasma attinicola TaxID=2904537 RepID=UPI002022F6C4|nr:MULTISPECIES: YbaB/EbfC family nucleoid-associated protein [unclassified Spiroplasma]MCL6428835.1 Nucleoid-associated protein YbaB [Spiroplasma sp. JKS002669]MCL8210173.1 Nucleoid-associated protein YbaB [Spiroplasma sp. JKS002670]MCL8210680.1 Nucleoid-associated protein YbaB [Spiroplasma sp. JKS002671]
MNNFQQMLNQAKMAQKKHEQFKKEEFKFSKQGDLIKIIVSGSYKVDLKINFQELLIMVENDYEMLNDMIQVAVNEAISEVKKMESKIINVM